jgi:hypothetical protein
LRSTRRDHRTEAVVDGPALYCYINAPLQLPHDLPHWNYAAWLPAMTTDCLRILSLVPPLSGPTSGEEPDFWAAIKDLPGAERRNLERSWRLFDAWRSTIRTQFPKYAAMTPGEFYAVYLSLYDLKKPIPEPMTNLFNAMFGPGAPMGQTKGSPISYPFN